MTTASNTFRALIIYALVMPVALIIGYMVATPYDFSTIATIGLVMLALCLPLLLRWHHHLLFLSWNMTAVIFFLPGHPELWVVMAFLSLGLSVLQRTIISQMRFLSPGSIVLPIAFLAAVVYITARLTGGIGLGSLGADTVGGKRYIYIFAAMAGFLAMTARRIPPSKVWLFVGLYFLSQLTNFIGTTAPWAPPSFYFLYMMFPVDFTAFSATGSQMPAGPEALTRLYGASVAGMGACCYMLARYGMRGMLEGGRHGRLALFVVMIFVTLLGGFRSMLILLALVLAFEFHFERLLHSKYAITLFMLFLLGTAALIPMVNKLPMSIQRSLSFLPLDIDPMARASAEATADWRWQMWKDIFPEIPKYLLLGKGLAIDAKELALSAQMTRSGHDEGEYGTIMVGDYHSGPLSTIIPFGIFGVLGFVWLMAAIGRGLYCNFAFGDPELARVNTLLLSVFLAQTVLFIFIFGGFYSDLCHFLGLIGLSVAINGGIHRPVRVAAAGLPKPIPLRVRPSLQAARAGS